MNTSERVGDIRKEERALLGRTSTYSTLPPPFLLSTSSSPPQIVGPTFLFLPRLPFPLPPPPPLSLTQSPCQTSGRRGRGNRPECCCGRREEEGEKESAAVSFPLPRGGGHMVERERELSCPPSPPRDGKMCSSLAVAARRLERRQLNLEEGREGKGREEKRRRKVFPFPELLLPLFSLPARPLQRGAVLCCVSSSSAVCSLCCVYASLSGLISFTFAPPPSTTHRKGHHDYLGVAKNTIFILHSCLVFLTPLLFTLHYCSVHPTTETAAALCTLSD